MKSSLKSIGYSSITEIFQLHYLSKFKHEILKQLQKATSPWFDFFKSLKTDIPWVFGNCVDMKCVHLWTKYPIIFLIGERVPITMMCFRINSQSISPFIVSKKTPMNEFPFQRVSMYFSIVGYSFILRITDWDVIVRSGETLISLFALRASLTIILFIRHRRSRRRSPRNSLRNIFLK